MGVVMERVGRAGATVWRSGESRLKCHQGLVGGLGLAGLVVGCAVWLFHEGRNLTFYLDEWYFPLYRLSPFTANSLLAPHNGHITIVPALIYEALLRTVGMTQYTAYRSLVLGAHLLIGVLVYLFARRRIGPIAALAPTAVILLLGPGAENYLFAFQIDFLGPGITGLACLLLIDHESLLARLAIMGLLIVSVFFSEVGLAFLVAVAVALAARRRWRDGWMVAIPGVLYVLWYLKYGLGQSGLTFTNFIHAPKFFVEEIAGAAGAAVGLDQNWGRIVAVALAYLVVIQLRNGLASRALLLSLLAGAVFFWLVIALTRSAGGSPYASRYLYIGCVFIVLIAVELASGRIRFGPIGIGVLGAATVAIVASNLVAFYSLRDFFNSQAAYTRADLGALEIAQRHVQPTYVFSDPSRLPYVLASAYFGAVARYGSAAYTPAEISAAPAPVRVAADQVLERVEPLGVKSSRKAATSTCHPATAGRSLETDVLGNGVMVVVAPTDQPVKVSARRFAPSASVSIGRFDPGKRYLVTSQPDDSTTPWKLVTKSAAPYKLCTASR